MIESREIVIESREIVIECKIFYHDFAIEIVMESTKIIENGFSNPMCYTFPSECEGK